MPALRLFIAIDTPSTIKSQVVEIRDRLKQCNAEVKWEPAEKLHATLKFLGDVQDDLLPQIVSSLEGVGQSSFLPIVKYTGVGCFPNVGDPRIVWVGIREIDRRLALLHEAIETALATLGFDRESRQFHPHVTLGRVKGQRNMRSLLTILESITFESQLVSIPEIVLVKSELKPGGSEYTILKSIPLRT